MQVNQSDGFALGLLSIRELKQRQRRRLRKRHLKSEVVLPQTLSCLFHLVFFFQMLVNFLGSGILKDCIKVQEKKKKIVVLCSRPRKIVKLGTFTL